MRSITPDEAMLLRRLYQGRKFGGSHLLEENMVRGTPRNRVDDFRRALETLKRDGILQAKSTTHGSAVSIPTWLARDIRAELHRYYPDLIRSR